MKDDYQIYLAVDFMNADLLFAAKSNGQLKQKILSAIDQGELASDGGVRLYRTSIQSYRIISQLMEQYHLPFHEAAKPKEFSYENRTTQSA